MRIVHVIGARAPLHVTAAGKLFLLEDGFARLRDYAKRTGLAPHSKNSLTSLAVLERDLERAQRQGYATDNEEVELFARWAARVFTTLTILTLLLTSLPMACASTARSAGGSPLVAASRRTPLN